MFEVQRVKLESKVCIPYNLCEFYLWVLCGGETGDLIIGGVLKMGMERNWLSGKLGVRSILYIYKYNGGEVIMEEIKNWN